MSGKIAVRISDSEGFIDVEDRGSEAAIAVGDYEGRLLTFVGSRDQIVSFLLGGYALLDRAGPRIEYETEAEKAD